MRCFGLIGYPLGHSFSKSYFSAKFEKEGITDCRYELFPIENIGKLPYLLESHPGLEGLNVTIPYKRDVLAFLDESKIPNGLDACNCIRIKAGKLTGYNTDVAGFQKSFLEHWKPAHNKALVLGSGGAAAAVGFVLQQLGIPFQTVGRNKKQGIDIVYSELNETIISETSVIINCTPLGTYPDTGSFPPIPYRAIGSNHYLFDLVYNPAKSKFLQKGEEQGAIIENGYPMLVYQAEEAWEIWNS